MPTDVTREPIYKIMLIIAVVQFYPELKYILFPLLDMMKQREIKFKEV